MARISGKILYQYTAFLWMFDVQLGRATFIVQLGASMHRGSSGRW